MLKMNLYIRRSVEDIIIMLWIDNCNNVFIVKVDMKMIPTAMQWELEVGMIFT